MKRYLITDKKYDTVVGSRGGSTDLESLHQEILAIYKEVKAICDRHNLRYFAEGGTRVGAMLCNSILPNDDDLDIRMPREDYSQLLKIAPHELPAHLQLLDCTVYPHSRGNMAKIQNIETTFIEAPKKNSPMEWGGVFIDIVPYDNAPEYWLDREVLHRKGTRLFIYDLLRKKNGVALNLSRFKTQTWWYRLSEENGVQMPNNMVSMLLLYIYILAHPVNYYAKRLDALWQGFENGKSSYITCPGRPWEEGGRVLYIKREYCDQIIQQEFYDTTMPVPVGWQEINIQSYGYPARFERVTKKLEYGYLDLTRSYLDYRLEAFRA